MDTTNSYGAKARRSPVKGSVSRREATQSRKGSITIPPEETRFYTGLAINILKDVEQMHCELLPIGDRLRLQKEYARDAEEIRQRVAHEGLSFLTKTLPSLGKALDSALAKSSPAEFKGFEIDPCTGLPRFLGQLLQLILVAPPVPWGPKPGLAQGHLDLKLFAEQLDGEGTYLHLDDCTSDVIRELHFCRPAWIRPPDDPKHITVLRLATTVGSPLQSAQALRLVRQVCYSFYKLETPPDEKVSSQVLSDFVATDAGLPLDYSEVSPQQRNVLRMARGLVCRVLDSADPRGIIPRHGPGAVASGEKTHQKARFSRFYSRLNAFFPYDIYFFFNYSHLCDDLEKLQDMEALEAGTAKVVLVPKDSRGPRLISCEPLEIQWIQQGLMKVLVDKIQSHPLTRGRINFSDQGVNRHLAEITSRASEWNDLVTLDMKEASDRVSLALIAELFPKQWYDALYACRSSATKLPDGTLVPLRKFAPMGSAVCFPVEALAFWALGVAATQTYLGRHIDGVVYSLQDEDPGISRLSHPSLFYVYGDDIICPRQVVPQVRSTYEAFSLKLNDDKCCVAGFFRESCGVDSYFGCHVTPTKFRRRWSHRYCPDSHVSWVAYSNLLYHGGFARSAAFIEQRINSYVRTPYVNSGDAKEGSQGNLGFLAFERPLSRAQLRALNSPFKKRYNKRFQRVEMRAPVPSTPIVEGEGSGWEELLRHHTRKGEDPIAALPNIGSARFNQPSDPVDLLIEAGWYSLRSRVRLKLRWMPTS